MIYTYRNKKDKYCWKGNPEIKREKYKAPIN